MPEVMTGRPPKLGGKTLLEAQQQQLPGRKSVGAAPHSVVSARQPQQRTGAATARSTPKQVLDERDPVVAFLKRHDLQALAPRLLDNGFDDLETLSAMEEEDIQEIGVPAAYASRLRTCLRELRGEGPEAEENAVAAFLNERGLGQYAPVLIRSGFDEMLTLLEVEDCDLKDLGIPRGHALKLRRHLRDYAMPQDAPQAQEVQQAQAHVAQQQMGETGGTALMSREATSVSLRASDEMKSDVAKSWELVQEVGTSVVGEMLYKHTFSLAPQAVTLFPVHVRKKYRDWTDEAESDNPLDSAGLRKLFSKVVNAVGCTVAGLHDTATLTPMLLRLGNRHVGFGVAEPYWEILGKALMLTLRDILGPAEFTQEVERGWSVIYHFMSAIMIQGLREAKLSLKHGDMDDDSHSSSTRSRTLSNQSLPLY